MNYWLWFISVEVVKTTGYIMQNSMASFSTYLVKLSSINSITITGRLKEFSKVFESGKYTAPLKLTILG